MNLHEQSSIVGEHDERRSANYHPTMWESQVIESLNSPYTYDRFRASLEDLKRKVKDDIQLPKETLRQLELICAIQRLGVGYHFQDEIKQVLDYTCSYFSQCYDSMDLYFTALCFRVLRQNLYPIHSEVLKKFLGGDGKLVEGAKKDAKVLVNLYQSSYLSQHGEVLLEELALEAFRTLKALGINNRESPLHWRMRRLEARNFINLYEQDDDRNMVLLELAKLDFNLVQSTHQRDLTELSRWWRDLGFTKRLPFARDRLVENFIWVTGVVYEPKFSKCRIALTKFICILTAIDDIYDVYGSADELELFTTAVSRWNTNIIQTLPEYMKICYMAMFSFVNNLSVDIQRDQGINVLPYISKEWERLCQSYLVEARWFKNRYTPSLDEYLETSSTSVGVPAAMVHSYILRGENLAIESLDSLKTIPETVYRAAIITRLNNDLATSKAEMMRGDVPKSIQCYMNETGASDEEAREHVKSLISSSWKKLNEECVKTSLPKCISEMALNVSRTSQSIFEHGDGIGISDGVTKDRAGMLFVKPIHIEAS